MPRTARLVIQQEPVVYHVMSRTALPGFPFGDVEKDQLLTMLSRLSRLFFVEILGFALMGNHFHIVLRVLPEHKFSDKQIVECVRDYYGKSFDIGEAQNPYYRDKLSSLANFMKELKQSFTVYYNRRHGRRGTLWGERFKSVIVEDGETLINCLAYVELNPVRAGLVQRPEDYRWNSLGYYFQTNNKNNLLSMDFGLKEFGVTATQERLRRYRRYVYEAGAVEHPGKPGSRIIEEKTVQRERKKSFQVNRIDRFRHRTRYFTDSGIIGSKAFVLQTYQQFKELFQSKLEKKPKPIKGLDGLYSLKRLNEIMQI